jgi:hypothetical protein
LEAGGLVVDGLGAGLVVAGWVVGVALGAEADGAAALVTGGVDGITGVAVLLELRVETSPTTTATTTSSARTTEISQMGGPPRRRFGGGGGG